MYCYNSITWKEQKQIQWTNGQKIWIDISQKKYMANKDTKINSTLLVIKEMLIKTLWDNTTHP